MEQAALGAVKMGKASGASNQSGSRVKVEEEVLRLRQENKQLKSQSLSISIKAAMFLTWESLATRRVAQMANGTLNNTKRTTLLRYIRPNKSPRTLVRSQVRLSLIQRKVLDGLWLGN